jgi:uncharacterized protein YdeI (BOF family)
MKKVLVSLLILAATSPIIANNGGGGDEKEKKQEKQQVTAEEQTVLKEGEAANEEWPAVYCKITKKDGSTYECWLCNCPESLE